MEWNFGEQIDSKGEMPSSLEERRKQYRIFQLRKVCMY